LCVGSPFYHAVVDGHLVSATGQGLERAVVHRPATFNVFAASVGGNASLDVSIQGNYILRES